MLNKKFISLSFSSKKLQVLQLDKSKKKIGKFITVDLPEGLIVNHRVQDKEGLAVILKNIWKKLNLKERSVGIVIPEFSTFIKNLDLPKIEIDELDEAIRWQAHEFLPTSVKNTSMDWRITRRVESKYQILAVAVERELLNSYVNAVGMAGLFPLEVETPSISLIRVSNSNSKGKLIVYLYYDEAILIVEDGEKILGSSVVGVEDASEIVKTAKRIVSHYKEASVERILVGGINVNQDLLKNLQATLNLPVNRLGVEIGGLSAEDIQKYLIPISLQFKKPKDPADEETINLLPKAVVKKYQSKRLRVQIWSMMVFVTFIIWSSFFATIGTYVFFTQQINNFEAGNSSKLNVVSETAEARAKIKEINQTSERVLKISKASINPQEILNMIYKAKPEAVTIKEYKLDLDIGLVEIKGNAATRGDLINFKQSLEEYEDFAQITIPISNFEVESNLEFELSIIYLPIIKMK